ncbi:hypothetical protein F441_17694 [Phytophthora nicotianae CJ01A1]|uniref:Uncharacterized protein n=4 Tax=Phytophthora nicotianae TaxID=4792 RepID=W2QZR6_PHYN3|nr:hypothetical protein PPTG_21587 [Phytophthora nicotianae INRA-310]ETI35994.1 hypothetical protein F443_17817 [Phytophthora nicotianae P1569]ETN18692.1 hypothetical protein PPTG_21587 [Phytophthora nicotianae INRA-310]ETO64717.1 hypothetical protein F444_17854 [Phytophthora nicotianae P1976]ETP05812.1 hypothetical protein F441_17694 [Phytophthora nicotianae CJ01A1]
MRRNDILREMLPKEAVGLKLSNDTLEKAKRYVDVKLETSTHTSASHHPDVASSQPGKHISSAAKVKASVRSKKRLRGSVDEYMHKKMDDSEEEKRSTRYKRT